jgi:hypothetical protein
MAKWLILIGVYLAAGMVFLISVNADQQDLGGLIPLALLAAAAITLGWGAGGGIKTWISVLIPWLLIPLALPFGHTNQFTGGDDRHAVALLAVAPALFSMLLVLLGVGARSLYERRRGDATPTAV